MGHLQGTGPRRHGARLSRAGGNRRPAGGPSRSWPRSSRRDAGFLHRFQREIETLSQLEHPAHSFASTNPVSENGLYFYAMEYVDGQEPGTAAGMRRPYAVEGRAGHRLASLPALKHVRRPWASSIGDLKPANILRTPAGVGQADRFRHRQGIRARTILTSTRWGRRHRRVPVAGAGCRKTGQQAQRPVLARLGPVTCC